MRLSRRTVLSAGASCALAGCATAPSPALPTELHLASATAIVRALRRRDIGAVELCDAMIERIEQRDDQINAVVVRDFDRARADAARADAAIARGDRRPLLGVPATVKEAFDLQGHATTFGLEEHRNHRAAADSEVVARMRAAGAVVLGKTNVPAGLSDWQTNNSVYGRTNNPYDLARTPGGSSGGGAAALAMGFSALEVGSDFGGSIRVPAAFCGVFGLKTSHGAVSLLGHAPGGALRSPREMLVAGPMARSADDLALLLNVIAGPDRDTAATVLAFPPPRADRLADYRVFILDALAPAQADAQILRAIAGLEAELVRAGAAVSRTSDRLPSFEETVQLTRLIARTRGQPQSTTSARDFFAALDQQVVLRRRWAHFFEEHDVVISPAFGTTAFAHIAEREQSQRTLLINGAATPYGVQAAWTTIASIANLPAAVAPIGTDTDGLPVAVQVMGPFLGDLTVIHFAGLIAKQIPPPDLACEH